ncbi:MAG: sulfurtransferase [Methylococcales bacterium]
MAHTTIISATELNQHLNDSNWVIVDCRFSLANTEAGPKAYRFGHISNARYADLNKDLSAAINDRTGRHPLPNINNLAQKLGHWGIGNNTQVVVYDDAGGAFAGRLWWLLRWLGHEQVAVLDGGIQQWQKQGFAVTTILPQHKTAVFRTYVNDSAWLSATQVQNGLAKRELCLLDARTPERFRGEQEPIDPVAGHIPGALNRPFQLNLDKTGLFLSPEQLRAQYIKLIGDSSPKHVAHQCGSGVTACHNLLAMELAGLNGSKLYAGSWSEWITDKNRAIAKG